MEREPKSPRTNPGTAPNDAPAQAAEPAAVEPYEPPKLLKFEKLEKLIVSGE
jgi:hypothetical protein